MEIALKFVKKYGKIIAVQKETGSRIREWNSGRTMTAVEWLTQLYCTRTGGFGSMILKKRIPESFYKLFRTKNIDAYMSCLISLYEENNRLFSSFGLTETEGRAVIDETIVRLHILWQIDEQEREEEQEDDAWDEEQLPDMIASSSKILRRFIRWGWINSSYDEKMNENVLSFPEYSQLYIELFEKMEREDDGQERQSILSIYSALFTYAREKEKDNRILENALNTSRILSQMLSNMQDGMRGYFEELASRTDFIGIQKVLIDEINNSDSRKYAILMTSDSFYRYKENVKELVSQILRDNEMRKDQLQEQLADARDEQEKERTPLESMGYLQPMTVSAVRRVEAAIRACDQADQYIYRIEREFDHIETKYNKLIEQKTVFAKRALARIHYILQEGTQNADSMLQLVRLLNGQASQQELIERLQPKIHLSTQYALWNETSLYVPRQETEHVFAPVQTTAAQMEASRMEDFVPKPLYTRQQLQQFYDANVHEGRFVTTKETVQSSEDLEKLLLLWQEASESRREEDRIELGEEVQTEDGFTYSQLAIRS